VPIFQDTGTTHLYNPLWDAHARSHLVWMVASHFLIFLLAIYLLWFKGMDLLAASLSLCMLIGYEISVVLMPLYGGVLLGEGGVEPEPFGIPINIIHFNTMLLLQLISLLLILLRRRSLGGL
tara:strand:- start:190 stop:555 length:366 start_codon:yes stop_codon:yes gene_type:complete